jgi:hypothetical protein
MEFSEYITDNALVLLPVLYTLGMVIKNTDVIADKYIPAILLIAGVSGAVGIMGVSAHSIIQGILVTGSTVYTNQLIKQHGKTE